MVPPTVGSICVNADLSEDKRSLQDFSMFWFFCDLLGESLEHS